MLTTRTILSSTTVNQVLAEVLAVMRAASPVAPSNTARTPGGAQASSFSTLAANSATAASTAGSVPPSRGVLPSSSETKGGSTGGDRIYASGGGNSRGRYHAIAESKHNRGGRRLGRPGGGGIEHIATQATFRLLDRLGHWAAGRGRRHGGAGAAGSLGWPSDVVRKA